MMKMEVGGKKVHIYQRDELTELSILLQSIRLSLRYALKSIRSWGVAIL